MLKTLYSVKDTSCKGPCDSIYEEANLWRQKVEEWLPGAERAWRDWGITAKGAGFYLGQ